MASKARPEAGSHTGEAAGALDRLYEAPFDAFVSRRREAAAALRASGDVAGSRLVLAATKPSRTAWAINQVARRRPELVQATFEAWAKAAAAQTSGEGQDMRATARAYRDRLADLVQAASDVVREDGGELTVAQGRRISATVQAVASADDATSRETLFAGRLVADIDADDPFGGIELGAAHARPRVAPPARDDLAARRKVAEAGRTRDREQARDREQEKHARDGEQARDRVQERQARDREQERLARDREHARQAREREQGRLARELVKARARVDALEAEAREARVAAREAEVAAGRAQVEAQRLRRAVEAVEKRLGEAKAELRSRGV